MDLKIDKNEINIAKYFCIVSPQVNLIHSESFRLARICMLFVISAARLGSSSDQWPHLVRIG